MTLALKSLHFDQFRRSSVVLLAVFAAALTLEIARPPLIEQGLLTLLAVVLLGAWYGGFAAGFIATVASLLVASYLFIPPLHSFHIDSSGDMLFLSLAAAEGLLVSWLCEQRRRLRLVRYATAAELQAVRAQVEQRQRALDDIESDLDQLGVAVPEWVGSALSTLRQGREFLTARYSGDKDAAETLFRMARAEQRIESFATALKDYSRRNCKQESQFVGSRQVLEQAIEALEPIVSRAGARIVVPDQLPTVCIRQSDLLRIFTELLSNAIRFGSTRPPLIQVSCREQEGRYVYSIADNGIGMVPFRVSKAFTLFGRRQADDSERLGVGLALTRRIVESYGGDIWLKSSPDCGTTVLFTLPVATLPAP